jgi:hypothetical protein
MLIWTVRDGPLAGACRWTWTCNLFACLCKGLRSYPNFPLLSVTTSPSLLGAGVGSVTCRLHRAPRWASACAHCRALELHWCVCCLHLDCICGCVFRYWPREDQWDALAPGCTQQGGGATSVGASGDQGDPRRMGGLLWVKGSQAPAASAGVFDCIGARTLPGRSVPPCSEKLTA